nr:F-box/WD repeat-containing protein sel-10-like [Cherax quadricarinatus]
MKQHSILLREEESNVKKCRSIDSSNIKQEVQDELEAQEAFQLIDTSGNDSKHQESLTSLSSTYSSPAGVLQSDKNNVSCVENVSRKTLASVDSLQHHAISQNASDVESKSQTSKKASKGSIAGSSGKKENFLWRECSCDVYTLEGHNDIVLGVDCTNSFVLSASRDTTVRVWRVGNIKEERSLRGHTAAVTVVAFLPESLAVAILAKYEINKPLSCPPYTKKLIKGECLRSIYTYNGITCLGCGTWGVVTGTEGGKLEIWCLVTSHRLAFINAFQSQTTALDIEGDDIYAGSSDGEFGIWRFDGTCETLQVLYIMEAESSTYVPLKHLASVLAHNEKCLLGDSGPNIKVVDWKKGHVSRLVNHLGDIGMTDSLAVSADGYLLAASYLVDSGCSSINSK